MRRTKTQEGITLVALIITIIILLILATVTIMSITGDGIISKSRQAKIEYEKGKQEEEGLLSGYLSKMDEISLGESSGSNGGSTESGEENSGDDNSSGDNSENNKPNTISKSEAFVGYYADVDGNGTVDGIIYADLAIGNTGDGEWGTNR